ncbi:MAG TPA: glycosyl hydrolase [Spirochaetota bacterium]|nr:glycosyl hydrolase [Spirochaetota bacterium]
MHRFTIKIICLFIVFILIMVCCRNDDLPTITQPDELQDDIGGSASDNARRLMQFLSDNYGEKIIAGQMDLTWDDSVDMTARVSNITGLKPGLTGYDFMNYCYSSGNGLSQVEEAIEWWSNGGIAAFMWHWRAPNGKFYTADTSFRINTSSNSSEWTFLMDQIDLIAVELKRLQQAGVPVLWRPLHEASGGWFWWGDSGAASYIILWNAMYDRLEQQHGLSNLIWVWNGQDQSWYPGSGTVDIIGWDVYADKQDYSPQQSAFLSAQSCTSPSKIVALTENGVIPDPQECYDQGVMWSWFMVWNDNPNPDDTYSFWSNPDINSTAHKQYVYSNELVLTLDELPDLGSYPLP